jgi:septin family protein
MRPKKEKTVTRRSRSIISPATMSVEAERADFIHEEFNMYAKAFVQSGRWHTAYYLVRPSGEGPLKRDQIKSLVWYVEILSPVISKLAKAEQEEREQTEVG